MAREIELGDRVFHSLSGLLWWVVEPGMRIARAPGEPDGGRMIGLSRVRDGRAEATVPASECLRMVFLPEPTLDAGAVEPARNWAGYTIRPLPGKGRRL